MGNSAQGTVLPGQVQAVKPGSGIAIAADGTITVDYSTVAGVMKLGQTQSAALAAYNGYNWPAATGSVGEQLTISAISGGVTTLAWSNPSANWSAKGQLLVGTGPDTSTLLNPGSDGAMPVADSSATEGISYSDALTSCVLMPAGTTLERPLTPVAGAVRFNTDTSILEIYSGTTWLGSGTGNVSSVDASGGTTGLSFSGGPIITSGTLTLGGTLALASGGTGATTQSGAANNVLPSQTGNNGKVLFTDGTNVSWAGGAGGTVTNVSGTAPISVANGSSTPAISISTATTSATGVVQLADATVSKAGTNTTRASVPAYSVPKDAANMTGAALIPAGTDVQRPATPSGGMLRFNTTPPTNGLEVYDPSLTTWKPLQYAQDPAVYPSLTVAAFDTVTWSSKTGVFNNIYIYGTVNLQGVSTLEARGSVTIDAGAVINGDGAGIPGAVNVTAAADYAIGAMGRGLGGGYRGTSSTSSVFQSYPITASLFGSAGASGDANSLNPVALTSGVGGASGASLQIKAAGAITYAGTASLKGGDGVDGNAPVGSSGYACGGGGGSGGAFVLLSNTSIAFSGSVDVSGGNGGKLNGLAYSGANAGYGGGGGGGWIVLEAPIVTNTGTVTKTGGSQAPISTGSTGYGGAGGSFAGIGGQQGAAAGLYVDQAAGAGYLSVNGTLS